ncbi:MAG: hypothetical protein GY754_10555 [bacterium]|nr:hypothetical protein [bacterium]
MVLIKLAQVFDVSIDYLLIKEAERKPLLRSEPGDEMKLLLSEIYKLSDKDQEMIRHMIDALIARNKVKGIVGE